MKENHTAPATTRSAEPVSAPLLPGELYLFHRTDPQCPPETSLWGIFDRFDGERPYLESSSRNLQTFSRWHALPKDCRYRRIATRGELRDYMWGLACADLHADAGSRKSAFSR